MENFQKIFKKDSIIYLEVINEIINEIDSVELEYLYEQAYKIELENDISEGQSIYLTEIIGNTYLASLMSMFRHKQWILGVIESYNNQNYLTFSANLRGLLESVSDSNFSLKRIPSFLNEFSSKIEKAIKKIEEYHPESEKDFVFLSCGQLEEDLLHFFMQKKLKTKKIDLITIEQIQIQTI